MVKIKHQNDRIEIMLPSGSKSVPFLSKDWIHVNGVSLLSRVIHFLGKFWPESTPRPKP